jgi:hypothetical protein
MILFNSFVFIFSIGIGLLVPISIIPKISLVGVSVLIFAIVINMYKGFEYRSVKNINFIEEINYKNLLVPVVGILLLLLLYVTRSLSIDSNITSNLGAILLHIFFLVFLLNTKYYLSAYLKIYILFVFIMSVSGILADFLVLFNFVSSNVDYVNISEMTNGSFTRDIGSVDSYIFPYNLSFIITGGGKLDIFGYGFYRLSGWAHEPTSASLFIMPAILLLIHTRIFKSNFYRFCLLAAIVFFWIIVASVGSFLAVIILYSSVLVIFLYTKVFPLKGTIVISFILCFSVVFLVYFYEELLSSSILASKFNLDAETFQVMLNSLVWFLPNTQNNELFYFSNLIMYSLIFLFLLVVVASLIVQSELNVYTLILMYIVIHSMKGSQASVYTLIFVFFWFYIAYFSISNEDAT